MKRLDLNILLQEGEGSITFIEKAGTGIKRMRDEAHDQSCPAPIFEDDGFFTAIFHPNPEVRSQVDARQGPSTEQVPHKYPASATEVTRPESRQELRLESRLESALAAKIVLILKNGEQGKAGLATELGHQTVSGELNKQVKRLQVLGFIEMTMPEKPNSRLQKYRLANKGLSLLESGGNNA